MHIDKRYLIHGFLPAFFSACCFAVMATCIKVASSELPAPQLVFFRSVVGLLIILTDSITTWNRVYQNTDTTLAYVSRFYLAFVL